MSIEHIEMNLSKRSYCIQLYHITWCLQQKLQSVFPGLTFKVDQKADAKYKPVSAASICAKVTRDQAIRDWNFENQALKVKECGSGYPGGNCFGQFNFFFGILCFFISFQTPRPRDFLEQIWIRSLGFPISSETVGRLRVIFSKRLLQKLNGKECLPDLIGSRVLTFMEPVFLYREVEEEKIDESLPKISKFLKRKEKSASVLDKISFAAATPYVRQKSQFFAYRNLAQTTSL